MKKTTRRKFLKTVVATGSLVGASNQISGSDTNNSLESIPKTQNKTKINRLALVNRHHPVLKKIEPLAPLSVGNGEFAFTCDVTGLQTFPDEYKNAMPLCTMSQWGWHTIPNAKNLTEKDLRLAEFDTYGRKVGYHTSSTEQKELFDWLRENPHRLHLGQIGLQILKSDGTEAQATDMTDIEQTLELWKGIIASNFKVEGKPVNVKTAVHPTLDLLAVSIESSLINKEKLSVKIAFPYGSSTMQAVDWQKSENHQSKIINQTANQTEIHRKFETDEYFANIEWSGNAKLTAKDHTFFLNPSKQTSKLEFVIAFTPTSPPKTLPTAATTFTDSETHWKNFWTTGGAVELIESTDKRAAELERRIVLSQYLTAINCSGSMPPQETGLTTNSWYGKFHLEMHWWHAAHFALWNRLPLLEKSLGWYEKVLPSARERAAQQGYTGARWAKMTAPDGRDSPSPIGPLLIWQQPHPIFYAELCYQSHPNRATLKRFQAIVAETAEFMASFAYFDSQTNRYILGPPVIPAQENHPARETWNPTYEIEYWQFGLKTAQAWRERLGLKRIPKWDDVLAKLPKLPVADGVYIAHENNLTTFTERNIDHPSMLAALGVLKGELVDRETMRATLKKVMKEWKWADTWGWDYPMTAMTAARLGEGEIAVDALLLDTPKNHYAPNGHNYQRPNLPLYLPGNGGLLYAIALMSGGWQGAPKKHAAGFPADGSWNVKVENLNFALLGKI
jgi:protein-glucosylgalactosylhydroxylysine glucosidase